MLFALSEIISFIFTNIMLSLGCPNDANSIAYPQNTRVLDTPAFISYDYCCYSFRWLCVIFVYRRWIIYGTLFKHRIWENGRWHQRWFLCRQIYAYFGSKQEVREQKSLYMCIPPSPFLKDHGSQYDSRLLLQRLRLPWDIL